MAKYFEEPKTSDFKWLKVNFPLLEIKTTGKKLAEIGGVLNFVMDYDEDEKNTIFFRRGIFPGV